jgi:hypothetical protein
VSVNYFYWIMFASHQGRKKEKVEKRRGGKPCGLLYNTGIYSNVFDPSPREATCEKSIIYKRRIIMGSNVNTSIPILRLA